MQTLSPAAQLVLQHHTEMGPKAAFAGHYVEHSAELPDEEALYSAYAELVKGGYLVVAHDAIGHAGYYQFRTVYRCKPT